MFAETHQLFTFANICQGAVGYILKPSPELKKIGLHNRVPNLAHRQHLMCGVVFVGHSLLLIYFHQGTDTQFQNTTLLKNKRCRNSLTAAGLHDLARRNHRERRT